MIYQSDYMVRKIKEDQLAEWVHQAEIDHLESELRPHSPSLFGQGMHLFGHLISRAGNWLEQTTWSEANGHVSGHRWAHR